MNSDEDIHTHTLFYFFFLQIYNWNWPIRNNAYVCSFSPVQDGGHSPLSFTHRMHQDNLQQATLCYMLLAALRQTNSSSCRGLALTELWLSSWTGRFHFHLISAPPLMLLALHQRPFVPVNPPTILWVTKKQMGPQFFSFSPLLCFLIPLSFLPFSPSPSLSLCSFIAILPGLS